LGNVGKPADIRFGSGGLPPDGGEEVKKASWRSELVPADHSETHKKGEWLKGDWNTGTKLWIGNNNGNSFVTAENYGDEPMNSNSYDLQSVVDKPTGQESSFVIRGASSNPDKSAYTITYVLAANGESIEIKNNGGCNNIPAGTYMLQ
jgi:hypothetical protein